MAGATGKFPDGKMSHDDEGGIEIEIKATVDGKVMIDFGKPIEWIAMSHEQAIGFASVIVKKARELKAVCMN